MSESKTDEFFLNCNTYTTSEPISFSFEPIELQTGIFDLVKQDNLFVNKVVQVFSILNCEVHNILTNGNIINDNELFRPLVIYGESLDDNGDRLDEGEAEIQISRILPILTDLLEKVQKLLAVSVNVINQIIAIYNPSNPYYIESFKNISLFKPLDCFGRILSFFASIDTVVLENDHLLNHWKLYRLMFQKCKSDPQTFGLNEEQSYRLEKIIKKIDGSIMGGKLTQTCLKHIIENTGDFKPNGTCISAANVKEYCAYLKSYLTQRLEKLNMDLGSITETNEKQQLLMYLGVFVYYCKLLEVNIDRNLFKQVWSIQKKVTHINIISHVSLNIEKFINMFRPYPEGSITLDPKSGDKESLEILTKFSKNFVNTVYNLRLQVMTWVIRMESDVFDENKEGLGKNIGSRIKLIINGIILAHQIRGTIVYLLNAHLTGKVELKGEYIGSICTSLELLKTVEYTYNKCKISIGMNMSMMLTTLGESLKNIIIPIEARLRKEKVDRYKTDLIQTIKILCSTLSGSQSKIRMVVIENCMDILIKAKKFFNENEVENFMFCFWKLEILQRLSYEIKTVCDTSFFYWYRDIVPDCFNLIFTSGNDFKRLYFFCLALTDTELPLLHVKYLEDSTILVNKYKDFIKNELINGIILQIAKEIENDLRMQVHSIMISNLQMANPCKGEIKNFKKYLTLRPLSLFESTIDIKSCVEIYLNKTFYEMTTLNLNDWKTYQQMRSLAKSKFDINLHSVYLPSQTLEQGTDILFILRNMMTFVTQHVYNLQSQIFIEVTKESNNVESIGIQQMYNSLCTHGIGVVNTIVNKTYQLLVNKMKTITQFIMDEYVKSTLMLEKRYWTEYKEKIGNLYPYERAEFVCNDIKNLVKTKDENTLVDKLRIFITQIGNALGFIRTIRSALLEFNSQNLKFFNHDPKDFQTLNKFCDLNDELFKRTNSNFQESIELLNLSKDNTINYLVVLLNSLESVFTIKSVPDLELFYFLAPAVTINYVETLIVSKDKILKKNIKDAYFTDDGFVLGLAFLLRVFGLDEKFESLHWFQSVIDKLANDEKLNLNSKKGKEDVMMQQNMSLRRIQTYKTEFELLYYTYNSANILFNS